MQLNLAVVIHVGRLPAIMTFLSVTQEGALGSSHGPVAQ